MKNIGTIDIEKYRSISLHIRSSRLILTEKARKHIIERRGAAFFEAFSPYFKDIAEDPDYIFEDKAHRNSAVASKTITDMGKHVNLVIRLVVESDEEGYENSIITAIIENDKRYQQRLRNNIPIYKRE